MTGDRPAAPSDLEPQRAAEDDGLWADLRRLTAARIGLRRTGASLATGPLLDFRLAHARARDAVHEPLDEARLLAELAELGPPVLAVASAAEDRQRYLLRPDLGRRLAPGAQATLAPHAGGHDVAFVIADGLSARAVQTHARPVLAGVLPLLRAEGWRIAPLVVVRHGRVAVGDAVADRNCISNIRPEGIGYVEAAFKLAQMLRAMRARRLSGLRLKDDAGRLLIGGE